MPIQANPNLIRVFTRMLCQIELFTCLEHPHGVLTALVELHPSGMESQPLQQQQQQQQPPAAAMGVDFDAVFGNKTTPTNGSQPAAGKAHSVWLSRQHLIIKT